MLDICELAIHSSLARKESRGPFFREDYPYIDNANFLKHTVLTPSSNGPRIEYAPVQTKYIRPEAEREDFLVADY
jgi:succinate dehydrogenase/fumarate reductase flavoprotein subunit